MIWRKGTMFLHFQWMAQDGRSSNVVAKLWGGTWPPNRRPDPKYTVPSRLILYFDNWIPCLVLHVDDAEILWVMFQPVNFMYIGSWYYSRSVQFLLQLFICSYRLSRKVLTPQVQQRAWGVSKINTARFYWNFNGLFSDERILKTG